MGRLTVLAVSLTLAITAFAVPADPIEGAEPTAGVAASASAPPMGLILVDEVPGRILDYDEDRILFVDEMVQPRRLLIEDRGSGVVETVATSTGRFPYGYLHPAGAIYVSSPTETVLGSRLYDWRGDEPVDLGLIISNTSLVVSGTWAIWNRPRDGETCCQGPVLVVRDLTAGTDRVVTDNASHNDNDVATNGTVVYWDPGYEVWMDVAGAKTKVGAATSEEWATYPLTDGINVVYRLTNPCCGPPDGGIWLYNGGDRIDLDANREAWPEPGWDYAVDGGWVAFTRGAAQASEVWTRSPGGVTSRRLEAPARIMGLNPDGDILGLSNGHLVVQVGQAAPVDAGPTPSSWMRIRWQADDWWLAENRGYPATSGRLYMIGALPTAAMMPLPTWVASRSVALRWGGTPGALPVASYDVRYRRAKWNGGFGSWATWRAGLKGTSATFVGRSGFTYCFNVRARDTAGTLGPWSATTCTAIPLDDRSLSRSANWIAGTGSAFYRSTWLRSSTYGARLTRTGVVARQIALLVTTCPTCGTVKVYWGSTLLRKISLYSPTRVNRRLITVKTFASARSGTLRVKVISSSKKVIIDGIAIRRN